MTEDADSTPDVAELRFEEAAEALETIIDGLERGDVPLEESLAAYERGRALLARCRTILDGAAARISEVDLESPDETTPADDDDVPS